MAIQAIAEDGYLDWQCLHHEFPDDPICGSAHRAHLDAVAYRLDPRQQGGPRGAMIDLPPCPACGAQTSLKADYTPKELFKATLTLLNEQGHIWAYALPLPHVYTLRVHWLLYERGRAQHAPMLSMPSQELFTHPQFVARDSAMVYALWFGFVAVKEHVAAVIENTEQLFVQLAPGATLTLPEPPKGD